MMKIIYCDQCNDSGTKSAFCHVELSCSEHCASCRHSQSRKLYYYFCSPECMLEYMEQKKERFLQSAHKFASDPKWRPYKEVVHSDGSIEFVKEEK